MLSSVKTGQRTTDTTQRVSAPVSYKSAAQNKTRISFSMLLVRFPTVQLW